MQLSGTIPTELGSLPILANLKLNGNRFTGAVPFELTGLFLFQCLLLNSQLRCGPAGTPITCPEGMLPPDTNSFNCPKGPEARLTLAFLESHQCGAHLNCKGKPPKLTDAPATETGDDTAQAYSSARANAQLDTLAAAGFGGTLAPGDGGGSPAPGGVVQPAAVSGAPSTQPLPVSVTRCGKNYADAAQVGECRPPCDMQIMQAMKQPSQRSFCNAMGLAECYAVEQPCSFTPGRRIDDAALADEAPWALSALEGAGAGAGLASAALAAASLWKRQIGQRGVRSTTKSTRPANPSTTSHRDTASM